MSYFESPNARLHLKYAVTELNSTDLRGTGLSRLLYCNISPGIDRHGIQSVLESEQKRSSDDALGNLWTDAYHTLESEDDEAFVRNLLTSVETSPAVFLNNPAETCEHVFLRPVLIRNVHSAFNCNIWICDASRHELAKSAEVECIGGGDSSLLLQHILQLFKDGVL